MHGVTSGENWARFFNLIFTIKHHVALIPLSLRLKFDKLHGSSLRLHLKMDVDNLEIATGDMVIS